MLCVVCHCPSDKFEDQFERRAKVRSDRVAKNEYQRLRNVAQMQRKGVKIRREWNILWQLSYTAGLVEVVVALPHPTSLVCSPSPSSWGQVKQGTGTDV